MSLSPPGFEALTFQNKLKSSNPKIPFADPPYGMSAEGQQTSYVVFFKTNQIKSLGEAETNSEFKTRAARKFMMHYFPEYYPFMVDRSKVTDEEWSEVAQYEQDYLDLLNEIEASIEVKALHKKPNPVKNKVVYTTGVDLYGIRNEKDGFDEEGNPGLPDPEIFLSVLNNELGRGAYDSSVSVKFQNIPTQMDQMTNTLSNFGALMNQMQQREGDSNMNSLNAGVNKIIKKITDSVHDSIDFRSQRQSFFDTDYFTVFFDDKTRIVGIQYFVVGATAGEKLQSTVGYITNIKYNPLFNDEVPLQLLKNYRYILDQAGQDPTNLNQLDTLAFFERLQIPGDSSGWGEPMPWGQEPVEENDYGNLQKALDEANAENPKDTEKILKLEEMMDDPVFKAKMLQAQKARKINTAVQVLDVIGDIAEMDVFNFMNATPEGRKANQVLEAFGITDLAKEAISCITRGMMGEGSPVASITDTVRDSILNSTVSLNGAPTLPSSQPAIKRPSFADFLPEKYFSVTGDPPLSDRIKEMLLNTITQAGFEIIKGLAEMFKYSCADILEGNPGEVDCGLEIERLNRIAAINIPNLEDTIAQVAGSYGLSPDRAYSYLSDVSGILNPIELCQLLNSPGQITDDTIDNILDFNSEYYLVEVQTNLNSGTRIVSFFRSMSSNVDTVTLCNEAIESIMMANVENCKVCFDDFPAHPAIETLARIADRGFEPEIPPPDFMCQDSDSYLSNPVAEVIIPRLFNDVMSNTQIYLAGSLESARTSLLQPIVSSKIDPQICGALSASAPPGESFCPEPVEINLEALEFIQGLFDFIGDLTAQVQDIHCADVEDQKFQAVVEDIQIVSNAISAILDETPDLIDGISDTINSLQTSLAAGDAGAMPHTEYKFPQEFYDDFVSAIASGPIVAQGDSFRGETIGPRSNYGKPKDSILKSHTVYDGDTFVKTSINLRMDQSNWAEIEYLGYDSAYAFEGVRVAYSLPKANIPQAQTENMAIPNYRALATGPWLDINLNPYIYRFVEPLLPEYNTGSLLSPTDPLADIHTNDVDKLVGRHHVWAYTDVIGSIFEYILANGAFNKNIINNLKLFKNNKHCTPENIGDLFDADGIIDQMRKEFAAAACHDSGSNQDKVRGALYFGLINMLIQAIIDEFLVSNIIVFSALNMEDVLDPRYPFREIMVSYVVSSFNRIILDGNPIVEREIFNYFKRVAGRPSVEINGGFAHSYAPTEVVPGFEGSSFPLNNEDLVRFMVEERFGYSWHDGNGSRSTLQAIKNVIDPAGNKKLFEDFFLGDVVPILDSQGAIDAFWNNREETMLFGEQKPAVVFHSYSSHTSLMYARNAQEAHELFRVDHPTPPESLSARKVAIRQSHKYQFFFNQAINKYACLSSAVLYNFYLVGKYLPDVPASFDSTKRAIIHMFNMTERSESQPALEPRGDEFVAAMADDGGQDMESMARDIFLKFLRETPMQILKGLCELIDPHIALTKLIKDFTGAALSEMIKGMQVAIDSETIPGTEGFKDKDITAEDIFGVIFCLYNLSNAAAGALADTPQPTAGEGDLLLAPRLTLEGIDFKGTVAGMFMVPPSPLGVIYLLLELLKIKIDEGLTEGDDAITDASETETEECPEGTTPIELV